MPEGIAEGIGASVRRKEDKKFTAQTHPPPTALLVVKAHLSVAASYLMQRLLSCSEAEPPPHIIGCLSEMRGYNRLTYF